MRRAALLALVAVVAACYDLDFTEPIVRGYASVHFFVEQGSDVAGVQFRIVLAPPSDDGVPVHVPDPTARVGGAAFRLGSLDQGTAFELGDTLPLATPTIVTFEPPFVPGVGAPPALRLPVAVARGALTAQPWTPGQGVTLEVPEMAAGGDVHESMSWNLSVVAWYGPESRQVFFVYANTDPGPRIDLAEALLPATAPDSMAAVLQLRRLYRASDPDSTYLARATVGTTLKWRVPVVPPT